MVKTEVMLHLERIPLSLVPHNIERLGGLTNRNFRLDCESGSYVLRLAGSGTAEYIDRATEEVNARAASRAGVSADILFFDAQDGTMVTRYLGPRTMSVEAFQDQAALTRAAQALRRLHNCGQIFQGRFELFDQIDRYLAVLQHKNADLPEGYTEVQQTAAAVRQALSRHDLPLTPCHCDPTVPNFIDCGQQMLIIDFEYAGNNDPMWDLGDLSVEGKFSAQQDWQLLTGYFGRPPSPFDHARMVMYKAMCDLLWTLWGVVQHVGANPAEDFWAYAQTRLQRCRQLMATPDFAVHLATLHPG